ncbi:GNAT family N-acetyltransferase [Acidihalobacter prosperus]|uniref:GNAT family N-acetyltransferase n=2 Tax=Acidihalobacter prosperus TaxID=160660 RepID=A0A1A6C2M9_9GAMM|nr:GNAT family N-acetyltransferase [Acidihalobacter prosperus]
MIIAIPMTEIRPGKLTDYPQLVAYDEFIGDRRQDFQAGGITVADQDGQIAVAYMHIESAAFLGWPLLARIRVHPEHRRCGLGLRLVEAAMHDARHPRLYATSEQSNIPMQTLLGRAGARP